jgi:APA family basic amino acid/polyamine antiporter
MQQAACEDKRRVIGFAAASAIVVSSMIGTGIFTTTGLMVSMGATGGDILLAWAIGGVVALCGALCYAEIGANLPHSGGEYHYLSRLLHPALGFMSGCVSLIVGFAAPIAAAAMGMHIYLGRIIADWPVRAMAAATILVLSLLHAYDVRLGSRVQTALTALKILLIAAFIGGVWFGAGNVSQLSSVDFEPALGASSQFAVVLVFVSFAYSGWNASAYIGAEIANPSRALPRSLIAGTVAVALIYLLINLSYLSAAPLSAISGVESVAHTVAERLWGETGGRVVSTAIALTLVVPVSAMILIGPRVAEAMARDRLMPGFFARLNSRGVPSYAVFLQAALAAAVAVTSSFDSLLVYIGFTLNIFAALTVLSLFRLRARGESRHRVCVGYPVTPIIFLAFAAWMTIWSINGKPRATLAGAGTLALCYLLYLLRSKLG